MNIKLYQAPMSTATPIVWALAELGLDYESITVDLKKGEQKQEELLAHNPMGQVPTLVHDGQGMFESSAIINFLGHTYGVERDLWPATGSAEHMVALTWISWLGVTVGASIRKVFANTPAWNPPELCNEKQLEAGRAELHRLLGILDKHLEGRDYITGKSFTLADVIVAASLAWITRNLNLDTAPTPQLAAWLGRCLGRESAKVLG
ncbi:glutathione S-transferase family protein [Haliangium ochraceum]|uniref:Glutathione S-transferase domain protein n=1 Tax=Haliangium ochraceum (strain DSM 14365 / JCM 11303 / SMP-2) TaxID=502025 RepID=D0LJ49_HALO1|nr:glutathione S-transferase family protein [Haliangium ochraceum]ACY14896.1 Glutathione S-transferase domain protein [Haliangium ochraceum DSM 14365]